MRRTQPCVLLRVRHWGHVVPPPTVARPSSYRVTQKHAVRSEERGWKGRQGAAALRYCCAIAFLEVSEFQQLPHGAITPQFVIITVWLSIYLSVCLSVCLSIYDPAELVDLGRFSFLNLYTPGRTPWMGDQPVTRPLATHRITQKQNTCIRISTPRVGYEPTITVFEQAKMLHGFDSAATVIGIAVWLCYSITCCSM
jgi:hypothetical protein